MAMFEYFNSRLLNARFYKLINSKRKINMNKYYDDENVFEV